tara:strand:+ start:1029 stop:1730 length:702 start_codon:yes stop_codon:yes gene_type:complete
MWTAEVQLLSIYKSGIEYDKDAGEDVESVDRDEQGPACSKKQRTTSELDSGGKEEPTCSKNKSVTASSGVDGASSSSDVTSTHGEKNITADEFIASMHGSGPWDFTVSKDFWSHESLDAIHLSGNIHNQVKEMIINASSTNKKFIFNLNDNQMIIWCKKENTVNNIVKLTLSNVQVKNTRKKMFTTVLDNIKKQCHEITFPNVVSETLQDILEKNFFENTNERRFVWNLTNEY